MEILKNYKIGALNVAVRFDPNLMQDEEKLGYFSPRNLEIVLYDNLAYGAKEVILVHEILEVIKYFYHVQLKHDELNTLANCLHQVLEDNYFGKKKGKGNG